VSKRKRKDPSEVVRSAHWEERRDAILRAGAELFAVQGFHRTTIQDVMDRFDSTSAAFYYYYSDKIELLAGVLDQFLGRAENRLRWLDTHSLPDWVKLRLILAQHATVVASDPSGAAVLFEELQTLPEPVRGKTYARIAAYTHRLEEIFAAGVEQGQLVPLNPQVAVALLLGMCNHTYRWFHPSGTLSPEDLGEIVAEMGMRAVSKSADQPCDSELNALLQTVEDAHPAKTKDSDAR
jgi:AcrR family transcriptional regulator